MPGIDGETLRAWRRSRGWDVPKAARELRRASNEPIAAHEGLVRMIRSWERGDHELTERYELLYRALGLDQAAQPDAQAVKDREPEHESAADEASNVMAWITGTNTSDDAIEEMDRAASYLAEAHTQVAAARVLSEVLGAHQEVQAFLQSGKQRLRQTRELLRIDSRLLAHACLLLGDLGRNDQARGYGAAALLCAQEAEADEAIAWSVKAKTARWQCRFVEAAELARRGFEVSSATPTRVELAYREANAIALFGDAPKGAECAAARGAGRGDTARHRYLGLVLPGRTAGDLLPLDRHPHGRPRRRTSRCGGSGGVLERRGYQGDGYLGAGQGRSRHGLPDDGFP